MRLDGLWTSRFLARSSPAPCLSAASCSCGRQRPRVLREIDDFCACGTRNFFSNLPIVEWFDDDSFNFLRLHFLDDLSKVGRRRRNSGLRLEKCVNVQSKAVCEVWPGIMIRNHALAFEWQHGRTPFL